MLEPTPTLSRRRLLGGALAVAALPLAACGKAERPEGNLKVTDLTGHTVQLPGPAQRVVTIPMPAASMMVAVAGGPQVLAGMNAVSHTAIANGFLGEVYPELLDVPTDVAGAEFAPNVESVLTHRPDVVIQWGDRGAGIVDPLRNAGLRVAELTYGTQADLEGAITLYGELLGKRDRAARMTEGMRTRLADLRAKPRPATAPTVLYLFGDDDQLKVAGGASYNHFTTEVAGGRNPAAALDEVQASIDPEQLLAWDPDILLLGNFGPATPERIFRNPALAGLRAVRERRVYKVPLGGYRWDPPSQESPLMWQWLTGLVQGTGAPGLRAEVVREYEFLYNATPTEDQLDHILHTRVNADSAGYVDFGR